MMSYHCASDNCFCVSFHSVENVPVKKILMELARKINAKQQWRFNINRSAVWEGAIWGFKRLSYEPNLMMSKILWWHGKKWGRSWLRRSQEGILKAPNGEHGKIPPCLREKKTAKTLLSTVLVLTPRFKINNIKDIFFYLDLYMHFELIYNLNWYNTLCSSFPLSSVDL